MQLHRPSGYHGINSHYRIELRALPDGEINRRRALLAEKIRVSLASPEVFLAWNSLKHWREYARRHPALASDLESAEADLADLDAEADRRARQP